MEVRHNDRYEILTPTGFQPFLAIRQSVSQGGLRVRLTNGKSIECTDGHLFLDEQDKFIPARRLQVGTKLKGGEVASVTSADCKVYYDPVEVGNGSQYLTETLVSHNCEFVGAADSLISSSKMMAMQHQPPISNENGLAVFEQPTDGHHYIITADTSEGIGQDYSAFSVIDITAKPFAQVARFYENKTGVDVYPYIIHETAKKYNNAHVFCELNDIGDQVAKTIWWEFEYENVIMTRAKKPFGQELTFMASKGSKPGVKTSTAVKRVGCSNLKHLIEGDQLTIKDWNTKQELSNFVKVGTTFQAKDGQHDDLVMGLVLFGWLVKQPGFEFLSSTKIVPAQDKVDFVMPRAINTMGRIASQERDDSGTLWHLVDQMPVPRRM